MGSEADLMSKEQEDLQEVSKLPPMPQFQPPVVILCDSCKQPITAYCDWLPFPAPGRVIFLKSFPIECPLCRGMTINVPMEPLPPVPVEPDKTAGGVVLPGRTPNRQQRRHPEAWS